MIDFNNPEYPKILLLKQIELPNCENREPGKAVTGQQVFSLHKYFDSTEDCGHYIETMQHDFDVLFQDKYGGRWVILPGFVIDIKRK